MFLFLSFVEKQITICQVEIISYVNVICFQVNQGFSKEYFLFIENVICQKKMTKN